MGRASTQIIVSESIPIDGRPVNFYDLAGFSEKQAMAFNLLWKYRYILYGGSRGPGKSYWLRWSLLLYLIHIYSVGGIPNVTVGLFCNTYRELQDRQISKINIEFPPEAGEIKETQVDGLCFFLPPRLGSGKIALRNLDDPKKYQSAEFAVIGWDEITQSTYETFNKMRGSMRWPGIERTLLLAATNPGGIGHAFAKQLWIDRDFPSELASKAKEFAFIKALPSDNPHLPQSYWDELNSLPEPLRSAWLFGNWDVFAGMAFPALNPMVHFIDPISIPDHWVKWRAIDWGYAKPWCCLWLTKDPDIGRIYVYREAYQTQLTDQQQARYIREYTPNTEKMSITYADPSMWGKKNVKNIVTTTADEYRDEGVYLTKADNDRIEGKRKVDKLLAPLPDGKPGLLIFKTCTNLCRTFPALPYDEHRVEDVDTDAEDHAYDALRYGLTNEKVGNKQQTPKRDTALDMEYL